MKHGKGTDLPGMRDPRAANVGVIYVSPDEDREAILTAILSEERLKREKIVLILPQKNKAFQKPRDFDDLKMLRRKIQAELIFVTPAGPGPAEFARQRRFAVFSTEESFVLSFMADSAKMAVSDDTTNRLPLDATPTKPLIAEKTLHPPLLPPLIPKAPHLQPQESPRQSIPSKSPNLSAATGADTPEAKTASPSGAPQSPSTSECLDRLKQGRDAWNIWKNNLIGWPDLRNVNLINVDLSGFDLSNADLREAYLGGADLSDTDLSYTDLRNANFSNANLRKAYLGEADLSDTDLSKAYLGEADLSKADLSGANLSGGNLSGANLSGANLNRTNLSEVYLSQANLSGVNLSGVNLNRTNLSGVNLSGANLSQTDLSKADLRKTILSQANLSSANLFGAYLSWANLNKANLQEANLFGAYLKGADLRQADLRRADLRMTNFNWTDIRAEDHESTQSPREAVRSGADLSGADLSGANLSGADLSVTNLSEAKLYGADLSWANLSGANFSGANLSGSYLYATSVWDVNLKDAIQSNLIIRKPNELDEPVITVDNLEIAQFIYLLLNNQKIREAIDTITSKVALILGRFTRERKVILDALRDELRKHNYLPILCDFEKPASRDLTETVSILAHLARFIVVDLTDPRSAPHEVATIIPQCIVPVQPLLALQPLIVEGKEILRYEYAMFEDLRRRYHWVLPTFRYQNTMDLLTSLEKNIIEPAEKKAQELER